MKKIYSILIVVTLGFVGLYLYLHTTSGEYYRTYSLDKQYSVYGAKYFYENFMPRFPGQSGDASGKVYLYDEIENKVIGSGEIPMLWMVPDVIFTENEAYYKGGDWIRWKLPRKILLREFRVKFPDGVYKELTPFGELWHEYQIKDIEGIRVTMYDYYYGDGYPSIEHDYEYFPDKVEDGKIWYVLSSKFYREGKLESKYYTKGYYNHIITEKCGMDVRYNISTGEIIEMKYWGDCYK